MPSLYLLIPIALLFVAAASLLYWWASSNGQFEDLDREGDRIIFPEPPSSDADSTTERPVSPRNANDQR